MIWLRIPIYIGICLGTWVIVHLMRLRLHRVYRLFCFFLAIELLGGVLTALDGVFHLVPDYRPLWLALAAPEWVLTPWMVYALLDAMLAKLPGVLSFSQKLLRFSFALATAVSLVTAVPVIKSVTAPDITGNALAIAVVIGTALERAVDILALLLLLAILSFVLWFPVQMPRNLIVFSAGLFIYFVFRTASDVSDAFLPQTAVDNLSNVSIVVLRICYIYWALSITASGEIAAVRIGHSWSAPADQDQVLRELEKMNAALLRTSRH